MLQRLEERVREIKHTHTKQARAPKSMDDFWMQQGWYKKRGGRAEWHPKWVRRDAIRFLVNDVLRKDPREITKEDFRNNKLGGLLFNYFKNSPYGALRAAGFELLPWEMTTTPHKFYEKKANRIVAVNWLVERLDKDIRDITHEDFTLYGLGGLLNNHYYDSPYKALQDAGYKILPWEMKDTPQKFYEKKEHRVAAVKWLIRKLKKAPRDIKRKDFQNNGLGGLLSNHHNSSAYEALVEAGLVSRRDEAYMRSHGHRSNPSN